MKFKQSLDLLSDANFKSFMDKLDEHSIFPAKLRFREDSYRTTPLNPALALISQKNNGLENEKTRQNLLHEILSGELPMTGLEPAPCCQE